MTQSTLRILVAIAVVVGLLGAVAIVGADTGADRTVANWMHDSMHGDDSAEHDAMHEAMDGMMDGDHDAMHEAMDGDDGMGGDGAHCH